MYNLEEAIRETNELLEIRPADLFERKRKEYIKDKVENPFINLLLHPNKTDIYYENISRKNI